MAIPFPGKKHVRVHALWMVAFFLLMPAASAVPEYNVGVSPQVLDLGTLARGSHTTGVFYVISSSPEDLLVRLEVSRGNTDFFNRPDYGQMLQNYSEEDASSWVSFFDNPDVLRPQQNPASGQPKGVRPVTFLLAVPADAEPGVHSVAITPTPSTPQGYGSGANIVSTVALTLLFTVPGRAVRQGTILDIIPVSATEMNIFFQNTGTVTIFPRADTVRITDAAGQEVAVTVSTKEYVRPDEMKTLKAYVRSLTEDVYLVRAEASYLTGYVVKDAEISISAPRLGPAPVPATVPEAFPWWIFAVPVIIAAVWYYRRRS